MPDLTPTEELVLDLLSARWRLRDTPYHVHTRHRPTLRRLAAKGLIGFDNGIVERHDKAWLTEKGIVACISPDHTQRLFPPTCRSFYIGPKTSERRADCELPTGHADDHESQWYVPDPHSPGTAVILAPVEWVDDEAYGRVSAIYGEQTRKLDQERRARFAAAIEELCPGADVETYMAL